MTPIITPFYAALCTILFIFLARQVIRFRWKYSKGLGVVEGELEQAVRTHGNFSEYVPLAFILIAFLEIQNWRGELIHVLGLALLISRLLHFWGLGSSQGPSKGRFYGMFGTFLVLLTSSGCLVFTFVKQFIN